METRIVTREEAETAFTNEFGGGKVFYEEGSTATIEAVKLPELPSPGGADSKGFLPLTYRYRDGDEVKEVDSGEGPGVDEVKAILRATLPDFRVDQRLELWFEKEWTPEGCDCGCGC